MSAAFADLIERRRVAEVTRLEAQIAELVKREDVTLGRYFELMDRFSALKLAGAVEVPKPIVPSIADLSGVQFTPEEKAALARIGRPEPDELKDLIGQMCGTDSRRRGMMLKALAADRANKVPDEKIRQLIEHGVESTGVPI